MLEFADSLRTWALRNEPMSADTIAAKALPDHRLAYLDYEGPVSGERGSVVQYDRGTFDIVDIKEDLLVVWLAGRNLRGRAGIERVTNSTGKHGDDWLFSFTADCDD